MLRPIQSTSTPASNVLLKVTLPKRTGRKRKRGSDEPFTSYEGDAASQRRDARDLLRSLRDNVGRYTVEPVGKVERTHVFHGEHGQNIDLAKKKKALLLMVLLGIPDFVFSTTGSPFSNRFRDQILPFDCECVLSPCLCL